MSDPRAKAIASKMLLGEGHEEVAFFTALLRGLGIRDVQVDHYGGKTKLGVYLDGLREREGTRR